jgi:RecB family exonuclease
MSSHKETIILPSSRAIREHYLVHQHENRLLPFYTTISEFMQRSVIVKDRMNIDDDRRIMLLLEAADFKNFSALHIERNFFTFTSNSSYIFRFFEELSAECVAIENLELADCYAEYEEHIAILIELYHRYKALCDAKGIYDRIFLPQSYELHVAYIKSLGKVTLHIEGYLTNFELTILQECAQYIEVILIYEANQFNKKLSSKFLELGIALELDHEYHINLNDKKILSFKQVSKRVDVMTQPFSQRLLQVAYVKERVYAYVNEGIDVSRIVVITPDENFADMLRDFDDEGYFNFAKGISLSNSLFYRALKASYDYLDNKTVENLSRVERYGIKNELQHHFKAQMCHIDFELLLAPFVAAEPDKRVHQILNEEFYSITKLLETLHDATLKSALHLFLKRIASRSLDDISGGKITVMGLLETRMIPFEGVIIVDFNEGFVPRRSDKDLFLNSTVRERSNLPTLRDRESLQKLYYYSVMRRAKRVSISYVDTIESLPSRFLKELGIPTQTQSHDDAYAAILFKRNKLHVNLHEPIACDYDFKKEPLSASRLKIFLTCKRSFYYRYIQKLKAHEIAKDLPSEHEIATVLHSVLKEVYTSQSRYSSSDELREAIGTVFKKKISDNILHKYQLKLWLRRLEPFIENEIRRFHNSVEVVHCEKQFHKELHGITLNGIIDRVDRCGDHYEILDYKSGSYKLYSKNGLHDATDFQLEFYYLLLDATQKSVAFYDLKECTIVPEQFLEEKLARLDAIIKELSETTHFNFEMSDDIKACTYCPYIYLCQRG